MGTAYLHSAGANIPMTHMLDALAFCLVISNDETAPDLTEQRNTLIR